MAVFDQSPLAKKPEANNNDDRPKAQVYGNIGYPAADPETGEIMQVSLPMGVAVDTMRPVSAGSSKLMQAKNALLVEIQELAAGLKPGEEMELPLTFTIRRVADHEQTTAANNPFIAAMGDLKKKSA